jgi:plasmid stabilization system protein ParE
MAKVNKFAVEVSGRAMEMLVSHARFLAQVNEKAADRLIREFEAKAKSLEIMPTRCPWLHDPLLPEQKYRKLLFEKRYLLVFQIKGKTVYIDAVVDCRQDYAWLLV